MLAFNVQPAKASTQTVYINSNGSVTPVGAPIATSDNMTYNLIGNISYPTYYGIVVQRSNIIIDGKGYTVQAGHYGYGLYLTGMSNVTIKNTNVKGFGFGIYVDSSSRNMISRNNITASIGADIELVSSSRNNTISQNNIANSQAGIELDIPSSNNTISENNIANSPYGINLASSNNSLSGNTFTNCGLGATTYHNSVRNNTVNGKPLIYLDGVANFSVGDAGQVVLVRCDGIRVENLNISRATFGVELLNTRNSIISSNQIANNYFGIHLDSSSNNSINGNKITANTEDGIILISSSRNSISGNNVTANSYFGIALDSSYSNKIYHNNFINNPFQVVSYQSLNVWDNGYPSGGNYWSDYKGVDLKSGPYQNETGSDGIGDTAYGIINTNAYAINTNNTDRYPLMGTFNSFNAGTWNGVPYNVSVVSNSTVSGFAFNAVQRTITFNVTGHPYTTGFCRVTIPNALIGSPYTVSVNGSQPLTLNELSNGNRTFLYFTYKHSAQQMNTIIGTTTVPKFPLAMVLLLLIVLSILVVGIIIIARSRRKPKP